MDSGDNWSLTYLVPGDPVTVTEALRGEMDSAGFEEISSWQAEDASATVMEGNGYTVSLMTADAPDSEGTSVTYTVTQQS
ncbi:hypothetical protein [Serinibacter salmoneus]|uniref:Uncharacterized protein n=1 Tax=Serinibacter salmoneus TaxID=556530 RepID=A0A2A9D4T7_9MICO|nr:hypothetical protein [Serinibacter salmoneus]PFG21336.1 hypothetical protein ATL40_2965 [Serinibacter salmoneus]